VNNRLLFVLLLTLQLVCASFFLGSILSSVLGLQMPPIAWALYELIEISAAVGLVLGVFATSVLMARSLQAQSRAETGLKMATGQFNTLLEERFAEWQLTPAERDVAQFCLKGLSIAEIAQMRETSEGTVKAQTNAIYRKSGVKGRTQLMSLFIEDLMGEELIDPAHHRA
jgi:DNA-binding CsgD family transcriptional regulator